MDMQGNVGIYAQDRGTSTHVVVIGSSTCPPCMHLQQLLAAMNTELPCDVWWVDVASIQSDKAEDLQPIARVLPHVRFTPTLFGVNGKTGATTAMLSSVPTTADDVRAMMFRLAIEADAL